MKWIVIALLAVSGCVEDMPIDLPFVDIGYTYECTVTITCDDQTLVDTSSTCDAPESWEQVTLEKWDDCMTVIAPDLGCQQWRCATECSSTSYCTLD